MSTVQRHLGGAVEQENLSAGCQPSWLNVEGAALHRAAVSRDTIYTACERGELRHARVGGRRSIRLKPGWVDDWLERHSIVETLAVGLDNGRKLLYIANGNMSPGERKRPSRAAGLDSIGTREGSRSQRGTPLLVGKPASGGCQSWRSGCSTVFVVKHIDPGSNTEGQ